MATISDQISTRIQSFTAELETLVRKAALEAVQVALGGGPVASAPTRAAAPARRRGRPPAAAKAGKPAAPAKAHKGGKPPKAPRRKSGEKRPPGELAALVGRAADWIKSNPGHGVEDMAVGLRVSTRELALPIQKLLGKKTIRRRGVKRATKYFPG